MAAVRRATPAATQRWRRAFLFGYAARVGELLGRGRAGGSSADARRPGAGSMLPDLPGRAAQVRAFAAGAFGRVRRRRPPAPAAAGGWDHGHRGGRRRRHRARRGSPGGRQLGRGLAVSARRRADRGRAAVYAAEEAAFGGTDLDDVAPLGDLRGAGGRRHGGASGGVARRARRWTVAAARAGAASSSAARRGRAPASTSSCGWPPASAPSPRSPTSSPTPSPASRTATTPRSEPPTSTSCALLAGASAADRPGAAYADLGVPPGAAVAVTRPGDGGRVRDRAVTVRAARRPREQPADAARR